MGIAKSSNLQETETLHSPKLSVIVPVYNSSAELRLCLAALSQSDCEDFEVWVVDDGSTEPVEAIVVQYGFRYLQFDGPNGPAYARNRGAEIAKGSHLVFVDADVCVHQDTLKRFAEIFAANPDVAAVLGSYDDAPAHTNFFSQYKNLFHHYVHQDSDGDINTFWSGCGAMQRELFLSFGGFDEARYRRPAIEDIELGTWVKEAGYKIILDSRIQVQHLKRWTFFSVIKSDVFDRGIPWIRLMWRSGASANTLNAVPSQQLSVVLVYVTILMLPLIFIWPFVWIIVVFVGACVMVLNRRFYGYFLQHRGVGFVLRVVPLHWLYFVYCGISAITGTLLYFIADRERKSAIRP
jgi:glycosyltransferase involved in cell wall biosynthesis